MRTGIAETIRVSSVAAACLVPLSACGAASIKGEIIDDRITLATDHAEPDVRLDLHNVGSSEPSSHVYQQIDDAFLREIDAVTD